VRLEQWNEIKYLRGVAIEPKQLLTPVALDGMTLKNRVVLAPMTRARAGAERTPNALMAKYYTQRASIGLLIAEATSVSEQRLRV
jgi:N-ethylmaleimide reductase